MWKWRNPFRGYERSKQACDFEEQGPFIESDADRLLDRLADQLRDKVLDDLYAWAGPRGTVTIDMVVYYWREQVRFKGQPIAQRCGRYFFTGSNQHGRGSEPLWKT